MHRIVRLGHILHHDKPISDGTRGYHAFRKNADYTFNSPCAWDDITLKKEPRGAYELVYFGTLAQRSETSRDALEGILSSIKARAVFFDVNIRKHFYTKEIIRRGLEYATILKMNDEELPLVAGLCSLEASDEGEMVHKLMDEYRIPVVLLTKGKKGSTCYQENQKSTCRAGM